MDNQFNSLSFALGVGISVVTCLSGSSFSPHSLIAQPKHSDHLNNGNEFSYIAHPQLGRTASSNTAMTELSALKGSFLRTTKNSPQIERDRFFQDFSKSLENRQVPLSREDSALIWDNLADLLS